MLSLIGLIGAIAVLMILAYKNWSTIIYSALAALIVCVFSGMEPWDGLINNWAKGTGNYVATWLILFAAGSIFGKIYQESGAAATIASTLAKTFGEKNAIIPILLSSVILGMSGISSFVLIFCIYPIALDLFAKANMSKRLLPAVFCYSVWTVAAVAPGSAQATNLIPMNILGTTAMAGAVPGFVFAIVVAVVNTLYIGYESKKLAAHGIFFEDHDSVKRGEDEQLPGLIPALIPIAVVIVGFNVFHWPVEIALVLGILLAIVLFFKNIKLSKWVETLTEGATTSVGVLMTTSVIVGFGAVVVLTPVYGIVMQWVSNSSMNPYLLAAIAANVFALILGSATSSVNLSMQTLGPVFIEYGAQGYNLGFIHRIISQAAMGLDTLPHCGALLVVFAVCGVNHKLSYKYCFVTTVLVPVAVTFLIQLPLCMILDKF